MRASRTWSLGLLLSLWLTACGESESNVVVGSDGGTTVEDAGPASDGGESPDAGDVPSDGGDGTPDGGDGTPDGGDGTPDGGDGTPDGGDGTPDGGDGTPDGGGGTPDGGGGTPDGGGEPLGNAPGYLYAQGGGLRYSDGEPVRLTGVNWSGFETTARVVLGLERRALGSVLEQVKALGYNTVRLPFSNAMLREGASPDPAFVNLTLNPQLEGLTSLQVLDAVISAARAHGLRVVLVRQSPDTSDVVPELWYRTERVTEEASWLEDWRMLARRYRSNPTVVGVDPHGVLHGRATWGSGEVETDWRLAAERAGNAILEENPHLLIIVAGVEKHEDAWYWWGGNLRAAGAFPVRLSVPGRLVYSTHDYPVSLYPQPWFSDATYPANLPGVWDSFWGYLPREARAPVLLSAFGSQLATPSDTQWMQALTGYLRDNGSNFAFWSLNPNPGPPGGLLLEDWQTVDSAKQELLAPALAPLLPEPP